MIWSPQLIKKKIGKDVKDNGMQFPHFIIHMNRFPQDLARADTTAQEVEGGQKNEKQLHLKMKTQNSFERF